MLLLNPETNLRKGIYTFYKLKRVNGQAFKTS